MYRKIIDSIFASCKNLILTGDINETHIPVRNFCYVYSSENVTKVITFFINPDNLRWEQEKQEAEK